MAQVGTPGAPPVDRYGTRGARPSRPLLVVLAVLVAAFLGWVVWAALGAAEPKIGARVISFSVVSDRAIDVTVAAKPGAPGRFTCTVRALDKSKGVVGLDGVTLDADEPGSSRQDVRLRTRDRAVTAVIGECSAA